MRTDDFPKSLIRGLLAVVAVWMAGGTVASDRLTVTTDAPGWTFTDAERPVFRIDRPSARIRWSLENWKGETVRQGDWPRNGALTLDRLPAGYYRVRPSESAGRAPEAFTFCVTPAARCRAPDSFFAADAAISGCSRRGAYDCPWYEGDCPRVTAELLGKCGFVHTRERLEWGNFISPQKGVRDFSRYLHTAAWMKTNGVVSIGCFHDTPNWNRKPGKRLPDDLVELYRFMEDAARTFDPYYDAWEFWNEPELGSTCEPVWEYGAALKAFALGARAGSEKTVILPGSFSTIEHGGYAQTLFEGDAAKYVQAFNLHTYFPPRGYDAWHRDVKAFLSEAGIPDWQVWLTESGTNMEGNGLVDGIRTGTKAHAPEQEMILAEFYPKSCILHQQGGIFRNWYFMFGCYNEQGGRRDWGSMRRDGTVKPIHASMAAVSSVLGDARLLGEKRITEGVRAFVYQKPDKSHVLAFWSQSEVDLGVGVVRMSDGVTKAFTLAAAPGSYRLVDMMGTPSVVKADRSGLHLSARRFPQYLTGLKALTADIPPLDAGRLARYVPKANEDLSVVIRPETHPDDFNITGGKRIAELHKETGRIRLEVWNLSAQAKRGRLGLRGGTFAGLPPEVALAPWDKTVLDVVYRPEAGDRVSFDLDIAGRFDGRRTSRVRIPVIYNWRFMQGCRAVPLPRLDDPGAWIRNDSAQSYRCSWDERERAVLFEAAWDGTTGQWFYPIVKLADGESLEGARYVEFEAKSWQDKVENDMGHVQLMLLYGADGTDGTKNAGFRAPGFEWEKRTAALPPDAGGVRQFRLGFLPYGHQLKLWLRNFKVLKDK